MTDKEILEGNKLIAEFMGGNINNVDFYGDFSACEYHTSWDWLMPVVEKIELITEFPILIGGNIQIQSYNDYYYINIAYNTDGYTVSRYLDGDFDYTPLYTKHIPISKIEAAWLAAVEFIKWYNEHKGAIS